MKTKHIILPLVALGVAMTSCKDQMDYHEYVMVEKDYVERTFGNVGGFMTQLYKAVDYDFGQFNAGAMSASATDEAEFSQLGNTITDFYNGGWSPANAKAGKWNSMYTAIQAANHYIDYWQGLTFSDYELNLDYAGQMHRYENYYYEARFLRAYFYFELNRMFGGVPIVEAGMSAEEINTLSRNTSDEVFEYILNECDAIKDKIIANYQDLGQYDLGVQETGRAGRIAVLCLAARASLYWASPLFNPDGDKNRYKDAADRYNELFEECTVQRKGLANKYEQLWADDSYMNTRISKEILYGYRYGSIADGGDKYVESHNYPVGIPGGTGGNCPTLNLVNAYEMKATGLPIDDPASGYDLTNPYKGRDPRFEVSIAFNGDAWPSYQKATLQNYYGGINGQPLTNATTTGFYLKKLCNGAIDLSTSSKFTKSHHTYLNFRYGGALLDYAEAVYQYTGDADATMPGHTKTARSAVNEVRKRAGMPNITVSGEDFWERLKNERFVELAFEGHRFWDVRRWKEGPKYFTSIKRAVLTLNDDNTITYGEEEVKRDWNDRNYFYPIPQTEIMKNPNLKQNPGW